ncbi:putative iron-regulated membrane protein [Rheinheimera pacifica]|uniref:PepSY-associated TM helix domain-containing protein n=1 Tax=Rheinheimera pacifica TaxID=173990 RepID=UPI002857E5C7|nr:PepSY-associated TM helix domain-containing protein [Rheinheimera pacifica]MDR6984993.1 putative iron-regulated membrane protein [Rheinheimera pacifica]
MRLWLRKLHLITALLSGIVVSIVGITGSLYVFEPELTAWLQRDYYQPALSARPFTDDSAIAAFIETQTGQRLQTLQWPVRSRQTYAFKLFGDSNWYYFDQSSGAISQNKGAFNHPFFELVYNIHANLLLGEPGRYITATASLLFALSSVLLGLYLWWPRRLTRWRHALKIHRGNAKRFNFELHSVSGALFAIPLFIMAITGTYFLYTAPLQKVLDVLTLSAPAPADPWQQKYQFSIPQQPMLSAAEVVQHMAQHYPQLYPRNIWFAEHSDDALVWGYQNSLSLHSGPRRRAFIHANPFTGEVLSSYDPATLPRGAALASAWLIPLHFGEFGGIITRILWFIGGFLPLLLFITGIKMWLNRRRKTSTKQP